MYTKRYLSLSIGAACLGAMAVIGSASAAPVSRVVANNLPGFAKGSKDLGATDAAKTIDVMIWLKVRNQAELDQLAVDLYDAASPNYRHWITPAQFGERFAPAAADAASVKAFFEANGLSVVETGAKNMFVRARGSVANVNKAFHVQLHDFSYKGRTVYANTTEPLVSGPAAAVTLAVYGLHNLEYTHPNAQPKARAPASSQGPSLSTERSLITAATAPSISSDCFPGTETEKFDNSGSYPDVTVKGNGYATKSGSIGGCGYTPPEIQKAYNLTKLYEEGFDGTGQTIVIIDWCGSPTIRADANAFSAAYGLPPLTTTNFKIINSSTTPTCGAPDPEINIDVEWAHGIAPGANIDLVVPPSASFADVDSGEFFAIINHLGSVISGSYGSEEAGDAPAEVATENLINEIAAVQGIAANFSSGDDGDFTFDLPQYYVASVSVPADSPYATAVGGISLALNSSKAIQWQTGWGTNETLIEDAGFVFDPPLNFGFGFGAGGGPSAVFSKPDYQKKLKGSSRLLPDISWLADPFTGGVIVISEPFQYPEQTYQIYGGTSLACPMFAALWAIANQEAGTSGPLGQAAPYLYSMPASTILDVKPVASTTNVTAAYKESATVTDVYTAADLADPLEGTTKFISAIWNYPLNEDTVYVLTFGTDSGLKTATGWDDVTGVGVPNGKAFADYFKQ